MYNALPSASPYNIVHLDLASRDGRPGEPYANAAKLLRAWRSRGVVRTGDPTYLAYESTFRLGGDERRLRGVFCAMELEPWGAGVLPHEQTMPGPVADRLELLRALETQLSAVYGTINRSSAAL